MGYCKTVKNIYSPIIYPTMNVDNNNPLYWSGCYNINSLGYRGSIVVAGLTPEDRVANFNKVLVWKHRNRREQLL